MGTVLALAALHENATSGNENEDKGTDGNAGDGGSWEVDSSSMRSGGGRRVDDLDSCFGENGAIKADNGTGGWLLLTSCFKSDEN